MYAVEKLSSYITRGVYTVSGPFHPFGGAVDIIVVQQQDGSFKSSPWYVRFGKFQGVLKTKEKDVNICVNGTEAGFHMYLNHKGEAYFLKDPESEDGDFVESSPPSSGDETDEKILKLQFKKAQSCKEPVTQMDMGNGTIVTRTTSRRSGIFGLMFGRGSTKESSKDMNVQRASSMERAEIAADLLETKWSTNLPINDRRTGDSKKEPSERNGLDVSVVDIEGSSQTSLSYEDAHHDEMISSHGEGIDDNFQSTQIINKEHCEEVTVCNSLGLGADEEVKDVKTSDQTTLNIDEPDARMKESIILDTSGDISTPGLNTDGTFQELIGSHSESLDDNFGIDIVRDVHFEKSIAHTPCSTTHEEVLEITSLETSDLAEKAQLIYESVTVQSNEFDVSSKESILKNGTPNSQNPGSSMLFSDSEQSANERYGSSTSGDPAVENGEKEVISFSYCETVESSNVKFSTSTDKTHEALNLPSGPGEEFEHRYEVISETSKHILEVKSQPESGPCTDKENPDGFHYQNLEVYTREGCSFPIESPQLDGPSNGDFEDPFPNCFSSGSPAVTAERMLTGSRSSPNVDLKRSESVVICQDKETPDLSQEKETREEPLVILGNQSQMNEGASTIHNTHIPTAGLVQLLCTNDKCESQNTSNFPDSFESSDKAQEAANHREGFEVEGSCLSNGVNITQKGGVTLRSMESVKLRVPSSENSEDDQFLFSDIDSFRDKGMPPEQSLNDETDGHTLLTAVGDIEEPEIKDINDEQSSESLSEASRYQTSPIAIPRNQAHFAELGLITRSLPIIRSHIHDLEGSNLLHPLSCSLNLDSEKKEQGLLKKEMSSSSNREGDSSHAIEDHCISEVPVTSVDTGKWVEQKCSPISPVVELSLCRHLLFEGMGADAASQAFNAEKVNLEKFSALGPSLVKNERLVVRMGDRYFPWDAAAPIILGMVSFGQGEIFEPQGMIAVERAEESLRVDATRAMAQSGGSWKLWPFTFRKSKTITTVRSALEGANVADVDAASVNTNSVTGSSDAWKAKTTKIKEKSLTPTSEELASLNLKEGPNAITFTFSTAMLGRQQVDARIYLWKWNTRIVISDVDGTITKSDVLGQFMPLVGVDWSQTGVAHLFSAIQENGYQLLFLSARAISQAYITRQFLFNLKQDGKALPDGPVVISPDGLFPSLYREVIRRAPHEFKISCLEGIRAVFPPDCNPFYAGFGNRDTDEISYLRVGIPKGKIFIINPKGQVAVNRRVDTESYTSLHALVNGMFPPMSSVEQEDFNSWNYWKLPLPDIDV